MFEFVLGVSVGVVGAYGVLAWYVTTRLDR